MTLAVVCAATLVAPAAASATAPPGGVGRVFFSHDRQPGMGTEYDIHAIDAAGGGLVNLTPGTDANESGVAVDPTGRWLAFDAAGDPGSETEIWLMRSDGSDRTVLVGGTTRDAFPVFSADGKQVFFVRDTEPGLGFTTDIWRVNVDGSGLVNLSNTPTLDELRFDTSPDGKRIVFEVRAALPFSFDVYSMSVTGQGRFPLVVSPENDGDPYYSPDGKRISFTSGPSSHLFAASASGAGPVDLMPAWPKEAFSGSWSGNGRTIVFDDDGSNLFTVPTSGGSPIALTAGPEASTQPAWEHVFKCAGRRATIVGDAGPDKIKGTKLADVIVANAGRDVVRGRGGRDRICGGRGKDVLRGGGGADLLRGGNGRDVERQ
jgi:Tol biopolymer transport system component